MDWTTLIPVSAGFATVASAIIAGMAIRQSMKTEKNHYIHNYTEKLEDWYKETLQILKELYYMQDVTANKHAKNTLLARLSSHIDIGRGFFRNVEDKKTNQHKPNLFKGKRVLPIELLVMFHHMYEQNLNKDNVAVLRNIERAFVSEVSLYCDKVQKAYKIVPYTLTDNASLLLAENVKQPDLKELLANQDLVECVNAANETFKNKPFASVGVQPQKMVSRMEEAVKTNKPKSNVMQFFKTKYEKLEEENQTPQNQEDLGMELKKQ